MFRFGNRDQETTVTRTGYDEHAESAPSEGLLKEQNELQFKERTELDITLDQVKYHPVARQRSDSAKVNPADGGLLDSHSSVVNSTCKHESSESFLEKTTLDIRTSNTSCFESDVYKDSAIDAVDKDDDVKDVVTNATTGPQVGDVLDEELGIDFEGNPAIIGEDESITQLTSSKTEAAEEVLDMKTSDSSCSKSNVDEGSVVEVIVDDDGDIDSKVNDFINEEFAIKFQGNTAVLSEDDVITQLASSESEATIEVLDSYASTASNEEIADAEDAHLTSPGPVENDNSTFKCVPTEARDDDNLIQVASEAEMINNEEMSPKTVEGYVDADEAGNSMVVST